MYTSCAVFCHNQRSFGLAIDDTIYDYIYIYIYRLLHFAKINIVYTTRHAFLLVTAYRCDAICLRTFRRDKLILVLFSEPIICYQIDTRGGSYATEVTVHAYYECSSLR